jgi:hypothetical protein
MDQLTKKLEVYKFKNDAKTYFIFSLQLCAILGGVRPGYYLQFQELNDRDMKAIFDEVSYKDSAYLTNFILSYVVKNTQKKIEENLNNLVYVGNWKRDVLLFNLNNEQNLKLGREGKISDKFLGKALGLCGTFDPENDVPKIVFRIMSSYSGRFLDQQINFEEELITYVSHADERDTCNENANKLINSFRTLFPKITFFLETEETITSSEIEDYIFQRNGKDLKKAPRRKFDEIVHEVLNLAYNIMFNFDKFGGRPVLRQETFSEETLGMFKFIWAYHKNDPMQKIYTKLQDDDRETYDQEMGRLTVLIKKLLEGKDPTLSITRKRKER